MTRVAFYAPMKPPDHPVPSGDRRMAQAFTALLGSLGHEVEVACRFRSYDRTGDAARQEGLGRLGQRLAGRLVERYRKRPPAERPACWFTYHLYHKAPDWLGPSVAQRLAIPYLVAEASIARKQAQGPWAFGYAASRRAIAAADLALAMTRQDAEGLADVAQPSRVLLFPPFLDTRPFVAAAARRAAHRVQLAARYGLDPAQPWLLAVAMMRADVKERSYALLAEALALCLASDWQLLLVGDGEARPAIEAGFAAYVPSERVRLLGRLPESELPGVYAATDLYVWPALAEAYGMAMLEAQAAGVPVIAGAEGGVPDILADGESGLLALPGDPAALAAGVQRLLADPERRRAMGARARQRMVAEHDVSIARARLAEALARVGLAGAPT